MSNKYSPFITSTLPSSTGANLALYELSAISKAKAVIQINHGMAEHAGRYFRFANALTAAGYHVYAHDHRGHGKTIASDASQGVFSKTNGLEKVIADVQCVNDHIKIQHPNLPVIMIGHSMGSIITLNYCINHSETIDAAMFLNSGVDSTLLTVFRAILKIAKAMKGSDVPSMLAQKLTFEDWNKKFKPNRTDFDWLSRDEAEVDKYIADPMCGFAVSNGLWLEVTEAIKNGADNKMLGKVRKDLPVYLLGGEKDPCTDYGKAMKRLADRMSRLGITDVTNTLLEGTRHESLNETNRDQTTKDLISWMDQKIS